MNNVELERSLLERCTFPDDDEVVCAVSGGADSVSLMLLALAAGKLVTVIHVDHGLREGSEKEAAFVSDLARRFGAACELRTVDLEDGPNLEARARALRYGSLPDNALTGHTADDQAETVLLNLARGAGLPGLVGMRTRDRPLLRIRRFETEALCRAHGVEPFTDPTNVDPRFRRNRIRNELLPLLADIADRDVIDVIAKQTELLRADNELLDELATAVDVTDAPTLAMAPIGLARRAVRLWLVDYLDDEQHPPSAASIERILAVARGEVTACEIEGGIRIRRSRQKLSIN